MTQCEHILTVLSDGDWHPIEEITALPTGGIIMEPHARRCELRDRGHAIDTRKTKRGAGYWASDWRLL